MNYSFYQRIANLIKERRTFVIVKIIDTKGSTPRESGTGMIVYPDRKREFTIGGGPLEAMVITDALEIIENRGPLFVEKEYQLTEDSIKSFCGGKVRCLFELIRPEKRLIIYGAGPVGVAIAKAALLTERFSVVLIDDRKDIGNQLDINDPLFSFYLADENFKGDIILPEQNDFCVVVTRCHEIDFSLCKRILPQRPKFIGVVGSKRKAKHLHNFLKTHGFDDANIAKIDCPCGIEGIGKEPGSIAISVVAKMLITQKEDGKKR